MLTVDIVLSPCGDRWKHFAAACRRRTTDGIGASIRQLDDLPMKEVSIATNATIIYNSQDATTTISSVLFDPCLRSRFRLTMHIRPAQV